MDISSILNHKTDEKNHRRSSNDDKHNAEESGSSELGQSSPTRCTADQVSPPSSPESTIYPCEHVNGSIKLDSRTSSVSSLQSNNSHSPTDAHVIPSEHRFQKYKEKENGSSTEVTSYHLVSCPTTSSSVSCSSLSSNTSPPSSSKYHSAIPKLHLTSSSPKCHHQSQHQYQYQNLPTDHAPPCTSTTRYQYHTSAALKPPYPLTQLCQAYQQSSTGGSLPPVVNGRSGTNINHQSLGAGHALAYHPVPPPPPNRIFSLPSYSDHRAYVPMMASGPGPTALRPLAPSSKDPNKHFPCTACYKRFARKSDLMRHVKIHTGEKPNVCNACGKTFIQRSALTVHLRVHTGEKPHKCDVCQKAFSDSSSLARHRRVHTGKRPYVCSIAGCGKTFTRRTTLTRHQSQHAGSGGTILESRSLDSGNSHGRYYSDYTYGSSVVYPSQHQHPQSQHQHQQQQHQPQSQPSYIIESQRWNPSQTTIYGIAQPSLGFQ